MAEGSSFNLRDYEESIAQTFPVETLDQLNQLEAFRKAFEINPELGEILAGVGISADFGSKGLMPSEWPEFGAVQKTLTEFKNAYDNFQKEMVSILQELARKKGGVGAKKKPKRPSKRKR